MREVAVIFLLLLATAGLPARGVAPGWPSLEAQIDQAGVKPDSALARLIAANQDFQLLRPDEAKDNLRIPLWLRVHWRKAHPEGIYGADPTGGYPLVLNEVWEWMLTHQSLKPGDAPADVPPERTAVAGADHRISGAQTVPRSESDIRIDFKNPSRIIAASNDIEGSGRQGIYYSTDGGATWGQTSLSLRTDLGDVFQSDPAVDWTSDGTAWSTTIGVVNPKVPVLHLRAYKSTDGGATWSFDATFSGTQTATDKPMIWVDKSTMSPFKDNLYAIWTNNQPVFMNRRTGPSGSWQTPVKVSGAETTGVGFGGDVKTNAGGDVFGFWPDTGSRSIFVVKSTDGGTSYSAPVKIATTFDSFKIGVAAFNCRDAHIYVSAGTYKTAIKSLVYASWTDLSGETGCTSKADEPGSNVDSSCKSRIWFARSTDGGSTWSTPVMLHNQPPFEGHNNDQFNQSLAVDPTNGIVSVIYYDTVADGYRKQTDVYYQSSFDDGLTWSAPLELTSTPTDETVAGADTDNQYCDQYGDYNGLSGYATKFFPSWTDRRVINFVDKREEIWTAEIDETPCTFPGAPTIGTATTPADQQVQVPWTNGAPAAAKFNVYRAQGTCAGPGTFTKVGSQVAASPFLDTTVSSGITYAYRVTGLDATGVCESVPSGCAEVTSSCTLPPTFAGVQTVTSAGTTTCGLNLAWNAATASCSGPVTYKIYRGIAPGFTPEPANLLASGVTGSAYLDTALLNSANTYYYVVHAVDAGNGVEETNTVEKSGMPAGPSAVGIFTETFEGASGFEAGGWSHSAVSGGWAPGTLDSVTLSNAGLASSCNPGASGPLRYFTLAPCRLLDTRNQNGPLGGPALAPVAQRTFDLAGVCGIPPTARALSVNLTVVSPGGPGDLRLFAADQATPLASAISFRSGETRANNAVLPLAWALSTFKVQNDAAATVHLVIDVNGYYE